MSVLFDPKLIGNTEIKNRFVHSATYECMADDIGKVTENLIKRYSRLAKGGIGLIIPGYCFVMSNGRAEKYQTGIHNDSMVDGLKRLVDTVHNEGSAIAFQLVHSGRQTNKETIGQRQIAPSKGSMDNIYMARPREMTESEIQEIIDAFGSAAGRAQKAGADGVQIHAAHGYLVNQFISPFFNKRTDSWGGSDENRFRFLKEVILRIRNNISGSMMLLVKMNTQDFTPKTGITLELAKKYASWLSELPIDGLEVSCGTLSFSMFNVFRGDVPTEEIISRFQWWMKILAKFMFKRMEGKFDLKEGYNVEAAKLIKPVLGDIPLMVVGGMRKMDHMQQIVENGHADFISMSRPFIKEPNLVNKFVEGKAAEVSCISCNKCVAGIANYFPVACYNKGLPT